MPHAWDRKETVFGNRFHMFLRWCQGFSRGCCCEGPMLLSSMAMSSLTLIPTWKRVSCSLPLGNTLGLTQDLKMCLDFGCWYWEHFGFQSFENKNLWFWRRGIDKPFLFFYFNNHLLKQTNKQAPFNYKTLSKSHNDLVSQALWYSLW